MKKIIRELRRREVFRTTGLYVGTCWILIEVGSVVLPIFDMPEWLLRGAIVAAVAGFPVMLVLAWFFDVSNKGIGLQADPGTTVAENLGARKSDFAVIGVLALALAVSLFLNVRKDTSVTAAQPVSVLVADIENTTGDPVFDGVIEEALVAGLEMAPHIAALDRRMAIEAGSSALDLESARDVAKQAGIGLLLAGSLQAAGNGYRIDIEALDVSSNEVVFELHEKARSRDAVLPAVGDLVLEARKQLGDATADNTGGTQARTFAAASLESAHAYAVARRHEKSGEVDQALQSYRQAIAADAASGRALSSLALLEFDRGNTDAAAAHWRKAQPLLETMTERERLRALGRYYTSAIVDEDAALTLYAEFVDKFPADVGAREKLAATAFRQLDFKTAVEQARNILQMYPRHAATRTQLALYALAAGDWDTASAEAERTIAMDPGEVTAYVPFALAALAQGQVDAARDAYQDMSTADSAGRGASIAELGLADIELFVGDVGAAQERLQAGIVKDMASGNRQIAALKTVALAASHADLQHFQAATAAATTAVSLSDGLASEVLAAMVHLRAGDIASAQTTADVLAGQADTHSRAYATMLKGLMTERVGASADAILSLRRAISTADLWLIRFETGKAYLRAGNYPEALGEFTTLKLRKGEAASAFLDGMPSYRLLAELPYWTGRVQEALNLRTPARASYEEYVALRPQGGALVRDARDRAAGL